MIDVLFNGIGWATIALTLNRVAAGAFFLFSGYHKLFDAQRHRTFVDELKVLNIPALWFNQWWVPTIEFTAGCAVFIGFLAPLAALGLFVILLVALTTSGRQRIRSYKAIDEADRIDDWLYLPETPYAFMLIMIISAGAGPYSLDAVIWDRIARPMGALDYSVNIAGGFGVAQLTSDYAVANGIHLPTKRCACTFGPDGRPILEMLMGSIDIGEICFT